MLDRIDLTSRLTDAEYKHQLEAQQGGLSKLAWAAREKKRSDGDGVRRLGRRRQRQRDPRRVTQAMDPRLYRVVGIAAPTEEERSQHYISSRRFWRHLPRAGDDDFRSLLRWPGRMLVERVEGFASASAWHRAYAGDQRLRGTADRGRRDRGEQILAAHRRRGATAAFPESGRLPPINNTRLPRRTGATGGNGRPIASPSMTWWRAATRSWRPGLLVATNDKKIARIQILKATVVRRLEAAL